MKIQLLSAATAVSGKPTATPYGTITVVAKSNLVASVKASGSITTVAVANLLDGETFTVNDGVNAATTFEFKVTAPHTVTPGNVAVDVTADTTADNVRDRIITAVNGVATLDITAADGGAATVDLTNDLGGAAGNTTSAETVANATFAVTDMEDGVDGETVRIIDGSGNDVTFEFDHDGDGLHSGNTEVDISAATTQEEVRNALKTAIDAVVTAEDLVLTTANISTTGIRLTIAKGLEGVITETVANAGFVVTPKIDRTRGAPLRKGSSVGDGLRTEDEALLLLRSTAGSGTMTCTGKLWGYSRLTTEWHPLGTGAAAADKGLINDGYALGETDADLIQHSEIVKGIVGFDEALLELTAIGGTSTAISAWLVSRR
jgi:hypothetical protein